MKITQHIKVWRKTVGKLEALDCVEAVSVDPADPKAVTVKLLDGTTRGCRYAHTGDYLVKFASGQWQRYGSSAFLALCLNPHE